MSCVLPRKMPSLQTEPRPHAHHGAHRLRVLGKINRLAERQLRVQMLQKVTAAPAKPSQRLLERLLGRRTNALTNFFANLGIVLCHLQPRDRSVPSAEWSRIPPARGPDQ